MKTRHLVLGLAIVLALSLAVPALGGTLGQRPSAIAKARSLVKRALKAANAADALASAAHGAADEAHRSASGAQASAAAAKAAAGEARGAAAGAQAAVRHAQDLASEAQGAASAVRDTAADVQSAAARVQSAANQARSTTGETAGKLAALEGLARNVLDVAEAKLGHSVQVSALGVPLGGGSGIMVGKANCPSGSFVSGGGFALSGNLSGALVSEPEGNGWETEAEGLSPFNVKSWAICLVR